MRRPVYPPRPLVPLVVVDTEPTAREVDEYLEALAAHARAHPVAPRWRELRFRFNLLREAAEAQPAPSPALRRALQLMEVA